MNEKYRRQYRLIILFVIGTFVVVIAIFLLDGGYAALASEGGKELLSATEKQEAAPEEPPIVNKTERELRIMSEEPPAPGDIDFKWAFVALLDQSGRNDIVSIAELTLNPGSEKPSVTTGDKISLYVQPGQNTYVYIYLVNSRGNLELLFPTSMEEATLKREFARGWGTYIPAIYEWFTFDENKGTETFYLIALPDRMDRLEQVTSDYINAEGDKGSAKQIVLDELKRIKVLAFSNPLKKPETYAGTISLGPKKLYKAYPGLDIANKAVWVKGKYFYSIKIGLKHE